MILAGWIVVLAGTLPHNFDVRHWRGVWVGFDIFLLAALLSTAWAAWRERQVLILLLMAVGTMLCCDAWFDVGTAVRSKGLTMSLAAALFAELPLALLAFAGARRLLIATVEAGLHQPPGQRPRRLLRRTPLFAGGLEGALPHRRGRGGGRGERGGSGGREQGDHGERRTIDM